MSHSGHWPGPKASKGRRKHRHERRKLRRPPRLHLELLEDRVVPATVSWTNPAGGAWNAGTNWSTGVVPTAVDDVVIDVPSASVTVTHSTGTDTIRPWCRTRPSACRAAPSTSTEPYR